MIRSNAGRCPISAQCRILGVAKSTYYWMLEHPEAERADPYEKDVERVWRDSGKVYGARKIKHALGHEGVALSRRRVNRIMKRNGMASSYSKAAYRPRPARPNVFLVKSVFRVSSLIFFGFRHEECRPVVCFTGCPSCRT